MCNKLVLSGIIIFDPQCIKRINYLQQVQRLLVLLSTHLFLLKFQWQSIQQGAALKNSADLKMHFQSSKYEREREKFVTSLQRRRSKLLSPPCCTPASPGLQTVCCTPLFRRWDHSTLPSPQWRLCSCAAEHTRVLRLDTRCESLATHRWPPLHLLPRLHIHTRSPRVVCRLSEAGGEEGIETSSSYAGCGQNSTGLGTPTQWVIWVALHLHCQIHRKCHASCLKR